MPQGILSDFVERMAAKFKIPGVAAGVLVDGNIDTDGPRLRLEVLMKPETRAAYKEAPPDHAPFEFGLLPSDTDEYIITSGAFKGQRGLFTRDQSGTIVGVDLAGRLFNRVHVGN